MTESPLNTQGGHAALPTKDDGYRYYTGDGGALFRTTDGIMWDSWNGSQWIPNDGGNDGYRATPSTIEDAARIVHDGYPFIGSLGNQGSERRIQEADVPTSDDEHRPPAKLDAATAAAASEADADEGSAASEAPPRAADAPVTESQIRADGQSVHLPYEAVSPQKLSYSSGGGAQKWTPPPGFRMGLPPIDSDLADSLGVDRHLGTDPAASGSGTPPSSGSDQPLITPEDQDEPQWVGGAEADSSLPD